MNRIKNLIAVAAFSLIVLGLPAIASAQYGGNDPYGRNGGYDPYGRNGNYGGYGNYGNARSAALELKDLARRFEKDLDRSPLYSKNGNDRYGRYGGYGNYGGNNNRASYVRKLADQFGDATSDLANRVNRNNDANNEVNRVMSLGSQLDSELRNGGLDNYLQDDWNRIQNDLRMIAGTYGRGGRNGGWNNGGWGNGRNNRNNLPSWWPF